MTAAGHTGSTKFVRLIAKVAFTLAAFWFVLRGVDMQHLRDILYKQSHGLLALVLALLFLQVFLGAWRWRMILSALAAGGGAHVMSKREALKIFYISMFFNCCLPGTVGGDVVRVWLAKSDHVPLPLSINSVIIDRVIGLAGLAVLVVVTLPMFGQLAGFDGLRVVPLAIALVPMGVWLVFNVDRVLTRWKHIRLVHWLLYFTTSIKLLLKHPGVTGQALGFALATHLSYCAAAWLLASSLGINVNYVECITLIPPVVLLATIPVSIGGWGVREAGMVSLLKLAGVKPAAALLMSVQLGLLTILVSLPAGLLWTVYRKQGKALPR